jgi:hypothetical protein
MRRYQTMQIDRQLLLLAALLSCSVQALAAEPAGAIAPAHGPMLMLYISQPLGNPGASRVYGLRLHQVTQPASAQGAQASFYAASPHRSLVDLQVRRRTDVRLAFGERLTWDMGRREFMLPQNRNTRLLDFAATSQ